MRKQKINIRKLVGLKVLQLVEPSENLEKAYLQKAEDTLRSTKILYEGKQYADAMALSYFSMYNSLLALLYSTGIKSENHNISIYLLKEIFGINNETIERAKLERKDTQYYPNFLASKEQVSNAIVSMEGFNATLLDFISKLNAQSKKEYLEKARRLFRI
jgi:uncharacterized protein (UPF0332 family)